MLMLFRSFFSSVLCFVRIPNPWFLTSAFLPSAPVLSSFRSAFKHCPVYVSTWFPRTEKVTRAIMPTNASKSVYKRVLPNHLIELSSPEGKARFTSALHAGNAEAFFPLVSQFQTQSHPAMCGLTTLTTILNALEIDPKRVWSHPWRWFAESLLDCCLDLELVKTKGITMDQLACTADCQGSIVDTRRGLNLEQARNLIRRSVRGLEDGSFEFVVASYDRKTLGQTGSGHFSPVAAYDEDTDSALVLDTARFKYGPHWIPLHILVEATKPIDTATGSPRGFMTFRKDEEGSLSKLRKFCEEVKCRKEVLAQ